MKTTIASLATAALLSIAASEAGAHPAVIDAQGHYVVENDGITFAAEETNGKLDHGMHAYSPSEADTALQVHDVCYGIYTDAEIGIWQGVAQGKSPFYDYIPWQAQGSDVGDDAASWLAFWQKKLGVDLRTITDLKSACETRYHGKFVPRDKIIVGPFGDLGAAGLE